MLKETAGYSFTGWERWNQTAFACATGTGKKARSGLERPCWLRVPKRMVASGPVRALRGRGSSGVSAPWGLASAIENFQVVWLGFSYFPNQTPGGGDRPPRRYLAFFGSLAQKP
jgi:hypothetical protein